MELSKRMQAVADFVPLGSRPCDIGTDHGYVPIYLIQRGIAEHVLAMDIRSGPLEIAASNLEKYCMKDRITLRLSDGLDKMEKGEADCIIIAGMGGLLIRQILSEGLDKLEQADHLILQPQSDMDQVRKWLHNNGFVILKEKMLIDAGKYYTVLLCGRGEDVPYAEEDDHYGRYLIEKGDETLIAYLGRGIEHVDRIIEGLHEHGSPSSVSRISEMQTMRNRMSRALMRALRVKENRQ